MYEAHDGIILNLKSGNCLVLGMVHEFSWSSPSGAFVGVVAIGHNSSEITYGHSLSMRDYKLIFQENS